MKKSTGILRLGLGAKALAGVEGVAAQEAIVQDANKNLLEVVNAPGKKVDASKTYVVTDADFQKAQKETTQNTVDHTVILGDMADAIKNINTFYGKDVAYQKINDFLAKNPGFDKLDQSQQIKLIQSLFPEYVAQLEKDEKAGLRNALLVILGAILVIRGYMKWQMNFSHSGH